MHKFRFIQVLLEHMSESATSNADVAEMWGVDRAQIGRDKQYIQRHLGEIETTHPLVYKSLLVAAVTYSFLSSGAEVDIDFGEDVEVGEPDESQRVPVAMGGRSDGDSPSISQQNGDVPTITVATSDSTPNVVRTSDHKTIL